MTFDPDFANQFILTLWFHNDNSEVSAAYFNTSPKSVTAFMHHRNRCQFPWKSKQSIFNCSTEVWCFFLVVCWYSMVPRRVHSWKGTFLFPCLNTLTALWEFFSHWKSTANKIKVVRWFYYCFHAILWEEFKSMKKCCTKQILIMYMQQWMVPETRHIIYFLN